MYEQFVVRRFHTMIRLLNMVTTSLLMLLIDSKPKRDTTCLCVCLSVCCFDSYSDVAELFLGD